MMRLTTALLTLGFGMATATTAIAQGQGECFWVGCNPEAPYCRSYCGTDPVVGNQWAPGYVAPTHHRSMYMYAPRHTHMHRSTNGGY
jgi:hypothetical protein